ncbi:MAG: hypothetical protein M0022_09105 [Desulfobacteraceae bacterium]|nr:hypothetical protein [Desulfobacteraceae bacterium]
MQERYTRFLKDISGGVDLRAIAEKYDLPHDEAMAAIERSISGTLSDIFRSDVECLLTERGCEIYVFRENGVEIFPVERLKKNILRAVKYDFIFALHNEAVARGYEKLRYLASGTTGGHVAAVFEDRIFVELDGGAGNLVVGVCEREQQTPKERGRYRPGNYYSFYISSVMPSSNGRVPVLKVSLSRTSRSLTEGLLRKELAEKLLDIRVRCIKRAAGIFSLVEAEGRIPRECIKAVSDELKERVIVRDV